MAVSRRSCLGCVQRCGALYQHRYLVVYSCEFAWPCRGESVICIPVCVHRLFVCVLSASRVPRLQFQLHAPRMHCDHVCRIRACDLGT